VLFVKASPRSALTRRVLPLSPNPGPVAPSVVIVRVLVGPTGANIEVLYRCVVVAIARGEFTGRCIEAPLGEGLRAPEHRQRLSSCFQVLD
jgi:hypothetical protein